MRERRAVFVSGASSGLGAATVTALAQRGYIVFGGVRTAADAKRIERTAGVHAVCLEVTDDDSVREACAAAEKSRIVLHALVNNAGIAVAGPLEYLPVTELRRQFEVNVFGSLSLTQAFLPLLRASGGRVVFVGSISGRLPMPYIGPYSASKAALRALAGALRVELAPTGVGIVLVEPASVRTPIWRKGLDGVDDLRRAIGEDAVRVYGGVIDAMMASTRREANAGIPVDRAAAAVVRAVAAKRPPAEVLIGVRARIGSVIALLPPRLRDRILVHSMGLPAHE